MVSIAGTYRSTQHTHILLARSQGVELLNYKADMAKASVRVCVLLVQLRRFPRHADQQAPEPALRFHILGHNGRRLAGK